MVSGNLPEMLGRVPRAPTKEELIALNTGAPEEEPEDQVLVASGALARLIAEAREAPASSDWERDLYEL